MTGKHSYQQTENFTKNLQLLNFKLKQEILVPKNLWLEHSIGKWKWKTLLQEFCHLITMFNKLVSQKLLPIISIKSLKNLSRDILFRILIGHIIIKLTPLKIILNKCINLDLFSLKLLRESDYFNIFYSLI